MIPKKEDKKTDGRNLLSGQNKNKHFVKFLTNSKTRKLTFSYFCEHSFLNQTRLYTMRFSVTLGDLQKVVARVIPAIPPKSTLPILEHIHCTASNGTLTMWATDQELTISSSIPAFTDAEGEILIPARRFNEIIKALGQEGTVEIAVSNTMDITLATNFGKYSMKGVNAEEFPLMPEFPEGTRAKLLQPYITLIADKTVFAASKEEYRPAMTGIYFQFRGDHLNAAATDSYRLSRVTVPAVEEIFPNNLNVIIPARTIELLRKADTDVIVSLTRTHAEFTMGNTTFITRVIDENFPPYENVIPKDNDKEALINIREIISAIKRVAIFTNNKSYQIKINVSSEGLIIEGNDEESGSNAQERIACDYSGPSFDIGFNYHYLLDALQHIETGNGEMKECLFTFSSPTRATLLKPGRDDESLLMLVMPTRL